jgi:hypothetical protein
MHEWIVRIAWLILGTLLGLVIGYTWVKSGIQGLV